MPFGIEFEVAGIRGSTYKNQVRALKDWFPGWVDKIDPTIEPFGVEVVSPVLNWDQKAQVFEMAAFLKMIGAKGNKTCGMHIHNSGNYSLLLLDCGKVMNFYKEKKLSFRPNVYRRGSGTWFNDGAANERIKGTGLHHDCISFPTEHKTVEFRLFNMCLHPRWIARCLHVVEEFEIRAVQGEFNVSLDKLLTNLQITEKDPNNSQHNLVYLRNFLTNA